MPIDRERIKRAFPRNGKGNGEVVDHALAVLEPLLVRIENAPFQFATRESVDEARLASAVRRWVGTKDVRGFCYLSASRPLGDLVWADVANCRTHIHSMVVGSTAARMERIIDAHFSFRLPDGLIGQLADAVGDQLLESTERVIWQDRLWDLILTIIGRYVIGVRQDPSKAKSLESMFAEFGAGIIPLGRKNGEPGKWLITVA